MYRNCSGLSPSQPCDASRIGGTSRQRLPEALVHLYDVVISFDHYHDRCWVVSTGWPEQDPARRRERARVEPKILLGWLQARARLQI